MSITEIEPQTPKTEEVIYSSPERDLFNIVRKVIEFSGVVDVQKYFENSVNDNMLRLVPQSKKESEGYEFELNENGSGSRKVIEVGLREGSSTYPGVSYAYVKLENQVGDMREERVIRFMNPNDVLSQEMPVREEVKVTREDGQLISGEIGYIVSEDAEFATGALGRFLEREPVDKK